MENLYCTFDGCERGSISKGLCLGHYQQQLKGKTLRPIRPARSGTAVQGRCPVLGCTRVSASRGLCPNHASIAWRFSIPPDEMPGIFATGCMNSGCGATEFLGVDHDHSCCIGNYSCGKCVRGVLCRGCNISLGYMKEDRDRVLGLAEYMLRDVFVELSPYVASYKSRKGHPTRPMAKL